MEFFRKVKCPFCFNLVDLFRISKDVFYKKCGVCSLIHTFQSNDIYLYLENKNTKQVKLFTRKDMIK